MVLGSEGTNMGFFNMMIWSLCVAVMVINIIAAAQPLNMTTTPNTTKPGCKRQCGNITVPYPFGIGTSSSCSLNSWYNIYCQTTYDPPRAYLPAIIGDNTTMIEVLSISDTQVRVRNDYVAYACYNSSGGETTGMFSDIASIRYDASLTDSSASPYRLSATANRLTVVGCNDHASLSGQATDGFAINQAGSSCPVKCSSPEEVFAGECNGVGCCQAIIQNGMRYFSVSLNSGLGNHTEMVSWDPCAYAFVGEQGSFSFRGIADLNTSSVSFIDRVRDEVPIVLDWVIGNETCSQAKQDPSSFLCKQPNTECVDADPVLAGYRCSCKEGYQGNPYLSPGCTDIDECEGPSNPCSMHCVNIPGNYSCSCPSGYSGDGKKDGTGCKRPFPTMKVALGASFGLLFLIIVVSWMFLTIRERRRMKKRNKFFQQNGGLLLKQLLPSNNPQAAAKIFTIKELMVATDNFSEESILGQGGYGTVYRGVLPWNQVVAIKKSKIVDESQIEQFINELVILTRIEHPNVVKLLGCCLEEEVPLLVYEFISNGTLYDHIRGQGGSPWLSWSNCLRIATEAAKALAYLHSVPIIHRDIKSMNILLDENYTAKIADFGISRLIPMDQTRLSTLVQGTLGYLDPQYFFSSQLTNKSDVYSFGVVLAELLTREAPLLDEKLTEERNLSIYFVKAMKAGRLTKIIDVQLVKEASQDQLIIIGELVESCLNARGEDRPTMEKVATVLEELYMQALKA